MIGNMVESTCGYAEKVRYLDRIYSYAEHRVKALRKKPQELKPLKASPLLHRLSSSYVVAPYKIGTGLYLKCSHL